MTFWLAYVLISDLACFVTFCPIQTYLTYWHIVLIFYLADVLTFCQLCVLVFCVRYSGGVEDAGEEAGNLARNRGTRRGGRRKDRLI